ncbi:PREDICTED: protein furry isoform X2 [Nicrophorus vespilloides]|uniref:Protein furry isoform X2 n=1 Tax=Nicrophorus vespilloides TaxID=110193 RepID=A0ABM1MZW1_NICVS|nr:PREDICTED: protein furry isoform X2 [Nicrophorus vespilloides]
MADTGNEHPTQDNISDTALSAHDSDVESSHSVCSGSDTHSGHTSLSGTTEKGSISGPIVHISSTSSEGGTSTTLLATANSPEPDARYSMLSTTSTSASSNRGTLLPWGATKERSPHPSVGPSIDMDIRPGEFVMRTLFADFTLQAERKIESVIYDHHDKLLSRVLQRGEDPLFDQLLSSFGSVAEHCLPSLLRALFSWYQRQITEVANAEQKKVEKGKSIIYMVSGNTTETVERSESNIQQERRDLAVEFLFCLVLIEVLKQLSFHPGHEDLVQYIESIAFKHFKYREGIQSSPNSANIHMIADLYAEVIGALAQSRFMSVRTRFMAELKELRSKDPSPHTTQSIISLLMGMKFFRVKMVPIEEFEASFQFMQECAQYFLDVKDKDIKHALAGLFVEILVPVAATVKNEVNVPCLKNFVEMLYAQTLDASTKSKHRLALFPLITCLLCVSQKQFFLQNWHYFLAMCLSHLKNKDPKMCRVALESLYRLLWVYMIRIKCESNSATLSRLQSIVNSLFPKGSKAVVPRDTPLNIFVKIIQFIAQERLDFAMREIVFDLLSVGRNIKIILTPERMSIGLRAFLVVADSLQQKEGEPPMPRSMGVLPSGNTLRVRKTFLNKMLTDDTARSIGMSSYFPHVRRVFVDILRALDAQYGRPLMMTSTQNVNKEPDEMITGERKPRIDLFRTCVAAVPRLIPDGMSGVELVDLLSRLTVHMDEELRGLAFQSLQTLVMDFPDWRQDVIWGFTQFMAKEVLDTFPQLVDSGVRMLLSLLSAWKNALSSPGGNMSTSMRLGKEPAAATETTKSATRDPKATKRTDNAKPEPLSSVLHLVEAFALVMLCTYRLVPRKLSVHILRDIKTLQKLLNCTEEMAILDVIDQCLPQVVEKVIPFLPASEKTLVQSVASIDLQWLVERNTCIWTAGLHEDANLKSGSNTVNFNDPWSLLLFGFLERDRILGFCPTAVAHSWPLVFYRLNALYPVIDPTPVNDNRASLLRSSAAIKKPVNERDAYIHVWKNYITFAFRVVPPVPSPIVRCASPDLSLSSLEGVVETSDLSTSLENLVQAQGLVSTGRFTLPLSAIRRQHKRTSSSPDSLNAERNDTKCTGVTASPAALYKLIVPLLRCEFVDVRDAAVMALGNVNSDALKDLMEELVVYIREAVDRKQENVRRRRRRDALRIQLIKVLELIAQYGTFSVSSFVLDRNTLHPTFVEYMEGARIYLESETDKNTSTVKEIVSHFCSFIRKMIKSFSLDTCQTLLKRDLRKKLFSLFSCWSGKYGAPIRTASTPDVEPSPKKCTDLHFSALQAMSALLCCGPCFDPQKLTEDGNLYKWLDVMLDSNEEKVYNLGRETVVLLLECNPDSDPLLDWTVHRCYTGTQAVADGCFLAFATIFSAKEYPCDHYTAVINVTLMNTGCPRPVVRDTALQLLQILDKRFFGTVGPLAEGDLAEGDKGRSTLDTVLATTYCRSQIHLSSQLSHLHPELTMPMFSEITYRFQTARPEVRQLLLQYLLPWLHNMELVDPNVPPTNSIIYYQFYANEGKSGRRKEGWGSAEATEMVLNNIFYITAKFGDNHPDEMERVWATLCNSWPNNMKVIIRYLIIISGMAPNELLPYAKRVILYLARVAHIRLLDEMMFELQTVETLNCLIERTETPPFYRLTVMRKASSHSDGAGGVVGQADFCSRIDLGVEKGTIHTKRHSGEDPTKCGTPKAEQAMKAMPDYNSPKNRQNLSEDICTPTTDENSEDLFSLSRPVAPSDKYDISIPPPHPLPMPEYGGFFAPLTEYLPDSSMPISGFHRCNVAVMLLCDVVVDGVEFDWTIHVPLMLHILFLGLDHTRSLVHQHCKQLLLNLLIVLAQHNDHLSVAHILMNSKTNMLGLGLPIPNLPVVKHTFTERHPAFDSYLQGPTMTLNANVEPASANEAQSNNTNNTGGDVKKEATTVPPVIVTGEDNSLWTGPEIGPNMPIQDVIKSLIDFLATRQNLPLWPYEDITAKVWQVRSADQIDVFLQHVLRVFQDSVRNAHISERWAQTALQLGLSCSSRHYAGRSLQIYRALRVPITSRMLSDILSRLVETVAEHGEDMQGYVTELLLTLESAVEYLESDFRPLDFTRDFFKSTPNLNNKESLIISKRSPNSAGIGGADIAPSFSYLNQSGHTRSTSYSVSYCPRKSTGSPASDGKDIRCRTGSEVENRAGSNQKFCSNLSRSRSAQSLKMLGDSATQDDKMTILAQLFWLSVSLLESDYEHEFLLALRLLARVMHRLPLDRPDARDKVEKLQAQLRWNSFPGVHALLLKGCTHPNIYEPVVALLSQFTPLLDFVVVDPSQSIAFPMNVIALLPYMLLNYEDANELCIRSAENIAQVSIEKSKKLENLGTVMNLYSRRTFSKESFQWTKCVIKYLYDTYAHLSLNMLTFLVEVLEKGPTNLQLPVLNILHCMLHYVDLASAAAQPINADLLRVIAKYIEGAHWKESLKILKLVVTRSSSLVAPPTSIHHWETVTTSVPHPSFSEIDVFTRKELPGRTMDFTYDLSQTPVICRRLIKVATTDEAKLELPDLDPSVNSVASPRRSCSLSPADTGLLSCWKRPWMAQGRVRECLVNLLTTCGQRVGLPKSPSVIFSQNSDILERQSSMASSTEEVSAGNNDLSGGSRRDDATADFGVFKDFDFLEYESESIEGESTDNFNWGVRRRHLCEVEEEGGSVLRQLEDLLSEQTPVLTIRKRVVAEESSDDEIGSESPLDEIVVVPEFESSSNAGSTKFPPSSLNLTRTRQDSSARSDTSGSSAGDLGDVTPCNTSPNMSTLINMRPITRSDTLDTWTSYLQTDLTQTSANTLLLFHQLQKLIKSVSKSAISITTEACDHLGKANEGATVKLINSRLSAFIDIVTNRILPIHFIWFNSAALNSTKLSESLRYGMLEVQEHLEMFCEKREQTIMYSNAVKSLLKLSVQSANNRHEDYLLDLGKALYKLHFQLLLLIEAGNKMITTLTNTLKTSQFHDVTSEVLVVLNALNTAIEDTEADGGTPTPASSSTVSSPSPGSADDLETALYELVAAEKWSASLSFLKHNRGHLCSEGNMDLEDDVVLILNIYCKKLVQEKSDCFVITNQDGDLGDVFLRLFQVSAAVSDLENVLKDRDQSDTSIASHSKD